MPTADHYDELARDFGDASSLADAVRSRLVGLPGDALIGGRLTAEVITVLDTEQVHLAAAVDALDSLAQTCRERAEAIRHLRAEHVAFAEADGRYRAAVRDWNGSAQLGPAPTPPPKPPGPASWAVLF